MRQFNHIIIKKDNASLNALLERMIALKDRDFVYDKAASERTNKKCSNDTICKGTLYALFTTKEESLYLTTVYVSVKDDEMRVCDINSSDSRYSDLGISRYNFVVNQFFHHFLAHCLDASFSKCISISGEEQKMENIIGKESYDALSKWESTCNKEAPIAHGMDEELWFTFVCTLFNSGKKLHPTELSQWLSEDCRWPSYYNNVIEEMAEKLEYSLSLLKHYDDTNNY